METSIHVLIIIFVLLSNSGVTFVFNSDYESV